MAEPTAIILNPNGNGQRDGRQWIARQRRCLRELAPAEVMLAASVEEAAATARQSALDGFTRIISVGAGATAHGVVNGMMGLAEAHRAQLKVGFLSFSRPDLWSRTLELPRDLSRQLEVLSAGHTLPFDVGRVDCHTAEGGRVTRHFLNGASFGLAGEIRREWRRPDTHIFRALLRIAAALRRAGMDSGPRVRLEAGETRLYEGPCALGVVMEGRYYPALGRVAPQASPTDGLLELAWLRPRGLWRLLWQLAGLRLSALRGAGGGLPWQSLEQLRAAPLDGPVELEADGQPVGRLPANFTVVPRTLPVIVAPVAVKFRKPAFRTAPAVRNGQLAGNIKGTARITRQAAGQ